MEAVIGVMQGLKGATTDIIYDILFTKKRAVAVIVLHYSDMTDAYRKPYRITFLFGHLFEEREIKLRSSKLMEERRLVFKNKTLDEIPILHTGKHGN